MSSLETMYPGKDNSPKTSITVEITSSSGSINLANGSVLPDAPNIAVIGTNEDAEVIIYQTKNGNVISGIQRGVGDTVAKSWPVNTIVSRNFTKYDYDKIRNNINILNNSKRESNAKVNMASEVTGVLGTGNGGTGNANGTVAKLTTARSFQANLGSASAGVFDGTQNVSLGVTGVLGIGNGGTGRTDGAAVKLASAKTIKVNLEASGAASFDGTNNIAPGVGGVLGIENGGTGRTDGAAVKLASAKTVKVNLAASGAASFDGTNNIAPGVSGVLGLANGGLGVDASVAANKSTARTNLGITSIATRPNYTVSSADLTDGVSELTSGSIYFKI